MPAQNIVKIYIKDGIYHIYNRGVEKRQIYLDQRDYSVFLRILKDALSPISDKAEILRTFTLKGSTFKGICKQPKNFYYHLQLLAYSLMPNHFHLLVKQLDQFTIKQFMQSIATRYSIYFNKRYKRVGPLFQSIYKAALIETDPYLLQVSKYIHRNPADYTDDLTNAFSSYADFLGLKNTPWLSKNIILDYFQKGENQYLKHVNSYQAFVENDHEAIKELNDFYMHYSLEDDNL